MVVFYLPINCPWCGHRHNLYVNQTMPLYIDFWHIVNMHHCLERKGGCGHGIRVLARPRDAYIEQQLPNSPTIDLEQFIEEVNHCYVRSGDWLARFNCKGTIIAIPFDVKIDRYEGSREEWRNVGKLMAEREVERYGKKREIEH